MTQCEKCFERFKSDKEKCPMCGGKLIDLDDYFDKETGEHYLTKGEEHRFFPRTIYDKVLSGVLSVDALLLIVGAVTNGEAGFACLAVVPASFAAAVLFKAHLFSFGAAVPDGDNDVLENYRPDLAELESLAKKHNFVVRSWATIFAVMFFVFSVSLSMGGA